MKIEVGKTYKSNITHYTMPGGDKIPEEWVILAKLPDGRYVGEIVNNEYRHGVVRVFDGDGFGRVTKSGINRKLVSKDMYDVYVHVLVGSYDDEDEATSIAELHDSPRQSTEVKRRET